MSKDKHYRKAKLTYREMVDSCWLNVVEYTHTRLPRPDYEVIWSIDHNKIELYNDGHVQGCTLGECSTTYETYGTRGKMIKSSKIYLYHTHMMMWLCDAGFRSIDYVPDYFMKIYICRTILHEMCHYIRNNTKFYDAYYEDKSYRNLDRVIAQGGTIQDEIETDEMCQQILLKMFMLPETIDWYNEGGITLRRVPDPKTDYMKYIKKVAGRDYMFEMIDNTIIEMAVELSYRIALHISEDRERDQNNNAVLNVIEAVREFGKKYPTQFIFGE